MKEIIRPNASRRNDLNQNNKSSVVQKKNGPTLGGLAKDSLVQRSINEQAKLKPSTYPAGDSKAVTQLKGVGINNDIGLEKEADEAGKLAANGKNVQSKNISNLSQANSSIQLKEGDANSVQSTGRRIVCNKSSSVKNGTLLNYRLEQLSSEMWPSDAKLSYHWKVDNTLGTGFIDKISNSPVLDCSAVNPGDYKISVEVLNNGVPVPGMMYSYMQNVYMEKKDTELGGLSVGNFDFKFDGKKIDVTVKVKFEFEDSIPDTEHAPFKSKFFNAIRTTWGSHSRKLEGTSDKGVKFDIPINIAAIEVTDNSYHKVVEVTKDKRRPKVIDEMNVYLAVSENTLAHEFGHVLGLDDEYDGGWLENIMFWHDDGSNQSDVNALMNDGTELRDRYYMLYKNAVESTAAAGYSYKIK